MNFIIKDEFFTRYQNLVTGTVIPYQEKIFRDEIPGTERSHAIQNFAYAAEMVETGSPSGEFYGFIFQDSDLAKWIEAVAHALALAPNPALEKRCDEIIHYIARSQHPDGYLNSYFTMKAPDKKWTNLCEAHELYCAGHLMEAAVAYAQATGKNTLLDTMERKAGHIYARFVTGGAEGYPGHPEIEIALMKMYAHTKNKKYLELAGHFINVRGVNPNFFYEESQRRDWCVWGMNTQDTEYAQNNKPLRELTEATGHSVRAVYLYTAMADYAMATGDDALKKACKALWENITEKRMYVTGAIGSAYEGEAFTADYHLPNDTAYAETCASIGLIFFARKMLELEKRGEYADVMERALYNCVLAGMELDGTRFFYVNPLEALPGISGVTKTHRHALPQRPTWFACACCPPNVSRLLASINHYAWGMEKDTVYSHLFIGGELDLSASLGGKIHVTTQYPNHGKIEYTFIPNGGGEMSLTLAIRLPGWSKNTEILFNNNKIEFNNNLNYAYITKKFAHGDTITLHLDMSVRQIYATGKINANSGKIAFSRGPFIYCAEGIDNGGDILHLSVKKDGKIETKDFDPNILGGITPITAEGYRAKDSGNIYSFTPPTYTPCEIKLIPYYTWANRGLNQMRVWLPLAQVER
ncbi:MAG: glycoside hydrolase family 127 protein [Defluviitaleaceae bacterium]|nr:glycoside hydrolase family 127 protein [Defluviitaleaceae bacterium]MCL2239327.1 glycoside hydrolase family 127 protein [Defluviitaleaceae bacterium]